MRWIDNNYYLLEYTTIKHGSRSVAARYIGRAENLISL